MNKITISENKTLKLQNVLSVRLDFNAEEPDGFDTEINKYIYTDSWSKTDWTIDSVFLFRY